ncbi:MAG: RCKP-type rubredoxin-like domain-containing protein [Dethiobacteraceae bacterium]
MAIWQCPQCGLEQEARCKPKKCPNCEEQVAFAKKEDKEDKAKKNK